MSHESRGSTVLTRNKGFEDWGEVLGDDVMAAALIDRLLHHGHIINIRGSGWARGEASRADLRQDCCTRGCLQTREGGCRGS